MGETLVNGLKRICENAEVRMGVSCELADASGEQVVDQMVANHLYCIAQEAVANAVRHGGARKIIITLEMARDFGVLRIDDDGCGFDVDSIRSLGSGLNIMKCRADVLGGGCSVVKRATGGMSVRCAFKMQPFIGKRNQEVEREVNDGTTV